MNLSPDVLGPLICGMRSAFACGENAMAHARATSDLCMSPLTGIVYPVLRGIPLLCAEHVVTASKLVLPPERVGAPQT
jgi:hypothetical protein